MLKRIFIQPELLLLLLGNAVCIWYYIDQHKNFDNIIWIYWFQSVIIGIFNFLEIQSLEKFSSKDFRMNNEPVTEKTKGCAAWFFLMHYGVFHFVYFIFLLVGFHSALNSKILLLAVAAFFIESLITFRRKRAIEKEITISIGVLFMLPYLRVIPMHLTILLPSFFGWHPSLLFLLLKTFVDILFYFITQRIYSKPSVSQS